MPSGCGRALIIARELTVEGSELVIHPIPETSVLRVPPAAGADRGVLPGLGNAPWQVRPRADAGRGVFLAGGAAPAAAVLTLYPGVHHPEPPPWAAIAPEGPLPLRSGLALRLADTVSFLPLC